MVKQQEEVKHRLTVLEKPNLVALGDEKHIAIMDAAGRAFQCISLLGFNDNDHDEFRIKALTKFMSDHFPVVGYLHSGSIMQGPHNNRKLTKNAFIQFFDQDTRNLVLKQVET